MESSMSVPSAEMTSGLPKLLNLRHMPSSSNEGNNILMPSALCCIPFPKLSRNSQQQ